MLKMVNGQCSDTPPLEAVAEVIEQCRSKLGSCSPAAGIFYTSMMDAEHDKMLGLILDAFPDLPLIGCTTDGEYSDVGGMSENSVVLTLFCSDKIQFSVGLGRNISGDTGKAVREAVASARVRLGCEPVVCIPLPDGLNSFTNPVAECLGEEFGSSVPVVGGTAGDGFRIVKTLQFYGREVHTDSIPIMLIGGDLKFGIGFRSGWNPIGPFVQVTKSSGPAVFTVNDVNILDFYKEFLGRDSLPIAEISPFSLAVFDDAAEDYYIRAPARVDEEEGIMYFAGSMPQGARFKMTEMGRDDIAEAAKISAQIALEKYPGGNPDLVVSFSCTSRRQILGTRTGEEQQALREVFGAECPFSGFYTYGEIAPLSEGGNSFFHNGTFVTLCLGEA